MAKNHKIWTIFASFFLLCLARLGAQDIRVTATNNLFPTRGGRVGWGVKNNLLAYDAPNSAGFYDVYTSNPDGTNQVCLTCGAVALPAYSKGNPAWDSTNDYLAVQVQMSVPKIGALAQAYTPGGGVGNDLYIMDAAGRNYWPVTNQAAGVLHPRFSHDGTKLFWVQRVAASQTEKGNHWNLMIGDYAVASGVPQVSNIRTLPPCQPANTFCETGGFSRDDSTVFFVGTLNGQTVPGDIYSYNLFTGVTTKLTTTSGWEEFPYSMLNSDRIVWMSGRNVSSNGMELQTDYWVMNYDGSSKVRLTYYNDSRSPTYFRGGISCARFDWSPDGTQMAAHVIPNGVGVDTAGAIFVVNTERAAPTLSSASYARPPLGPDSIVSTFYTDLAFSNDSAATTVLPMDLGGTTITVTDAAGAARRAPLFFVSPNQVNWLVPHGTTSGPATVQITNSQGAAIRGTVDVESVGPGLFTMNATGSGLAAGYLLLYPASGAAPSYEALADCSGANGCSAVAVNLGSSGDQAYLILFGTGLRYWASGVTASVGGRTIRSAFTGAQGAFTGLDQVNIPLPSSLAGSGLVNVQLSVDGAQSNAVQVLIK